MSSGLLMSRRIRRTPYTDRVEQAGVSGYTVVNHMLLPKSFQHSVEEDYWHLKEKVQIWDVSTQRQVEVRGKDAYHLTQWMTPRDLTNMKVGQCFYAPLVDENGGMVNDPVILKLAEDHFWLSIADSDVLLWAKGSAAGAGMDVEISEPDVSPLAVQGPGAADVMETVFGSAIQKLPFFGFDWFEFRGTRQLIARSGYSKQGGYEIYLHGSHLGNALWDAIVEAGNAFGIRPGAPNLIERIEAGLLSYGNEFTLENNPFEAGLENYCDLDAPIEILGRKALEKITDKPLTRQMRGVIFDGKSGDVVGQPWPVIHEGKKVGEITSGIWSPRFERCVGLGIIERSAWNAGSRITVIDPSEGERTGEIVELPF